MNQACIVPVIDGHNDTLVKNDIFHRNFLVLNHAGELDLPRAKQGGFIGGFFAIFVPNSFEKNEDIRWNVHFTHNGYVVDYEEAIDCFYAQRYTNHIIDQLNQLEQQSEGQFKVVTTIRQLQDCVDQKIIFAILHFEDAAAINSNLSNLEDYYQKGLRSLGLVWSRPNVFGYGVPFQYPSSPDTGLGLTIAGKKLVQACNDLGIVIDLAHINEKGFFDAVDMTTKPVVVTHTGVHAVCPSTRNLTDQQLDAIRCVNGVIGINLDVVNARPDGMDNKDTPLDIYVDHISYIADRIGVDHVAFGSDFDGAIMPNELQTVAEYQNLIQALFRRGFNQIEVEKIAHQNWQRVIGNIWKE